VRVRHFVLDQALPEPAATHVRELFAQVDGRELTFSQVARVRSLLNDILRREAGVLTYAVLPPQEVNDGVVRFEIHHGRIEKVALDNRSLVETSTLARYLPTSSSNAAPDLKQIEQAAQRMNALPGIAQVQPVLTPGQAIGTTDVTLQTTPAPRLRGALIADNAGSISSGPRRVGTQLALNSPFGIGDQWQALLLYAPPRGQPDTSKGGHTVIGQTSYELPLGYTGIRGGVSYTRINYRQGGPDQDVLDGNGAADVVSAYVNRPLVNLDQAHLVAGAVIDYTRLRDGFYGFDSKRKSIAGGIKLSGDKSGSMAGKPNIIQFDGVLKTGTLNQRKLGLFDDPAYSTAGRFSKFTGNFQYVQALGGGLSTSVKSSAQWANRHLDSSEQMSLGGVQGVRGYSSDLSGVDNGVVMQAALNLAVKRVPGFTTSVFHDYGRGQINKQRSLEGVANTLSVRSTGIGVNYEYNQKVAISLSRAWRVGPAPQGQPKPSSGQTWLSATLTF